MAAPAQRDDFPSSTETLVAEIETLMRRLLVTDPEFFEDTVRYYELQVMKIRAVKAVLASQARVR